MATIKDVAERAGVSSATVSNVLNGTKNVSEELRSRVYQAVEELHFHPDYMASCMKRKRTKTIGVIVTTLNRVFFSQMISGITSVASDNDYKLIFYSSDNDISKEMKYVDMLANSKVDGILLDTAACTKKHEEYIRYLQNLHIGSKKIPVISLEQNLVEYGIRSVHINNRLGGQIATEHLIRQGCRKIAFVSGPMLTPLIKDRYAGYQDMLTKYSIPFDKELVYPGDFSSVSGYHAANYFMTEGIAFDGIFACNDEMAIGVLKALKEAGRKIPEEIKVIGFDNTYVSSLVEPSVTTVNIPKHRLGSCAAWMLIDYLDGKETGKMSCELPITLTVRSSTDAKKHTAWELNKW